MWANRNSGDRVFRSGEIKLVGAVKGDNSDSRRGSGGAGGGMRVRFLGRGIVLETVSDGEVSEGVCGLSLSCLGFDFMGFSSMGIFFAGALFKYFNKEGEVTLVLLCVFMCVARPPAFLHSFPHFPQIYFNDI